jgi:hypothetical protein
MDLKQPFSLPDIRKYPKEVIIALLIGLLFYFITRADNKDAENTRLNARIDTIKTETIRLYEKVIFQEQVIRQQKMKEKATDSLLRQETQPQVEKLLK